jgi:hypothetical protein
MHGTHASRRAEAGMGGSDQLIVTIAEKNKVFGTTQLIDVGCCISDPGPNDGET